MSRDMLGSMDRFSLEQGESGRSQDRPAARYAATGRN